MTSGMGYDSAIETNTAKVLKVRIDQETVQFDEFHIPISVDEIEGDDKCLRLSFIRMLKSQYE